MKSSYNCSSIAKIPRNTPEFGPVDSLIILTGHSWQAAGDQAELVSRGDHDGVPESQKSSSMDRTGGVGCLSQSTICRFESLTLSHNNMVALKPILEAWLEEAERAQREKMTKPEIYTGGDKKRKRTSIAAPEKRSLEAYFAVQPRPSSEKIAAIAEKLDLKKNVVRVWFCNQRQKQKRMKFSAAY
ncbi:Brain-specific homeobox/POU domain protein 3 [Chelonia mydas]|uniref:POU domain protein n=1 Tax=Chelonia mydas TaxID=8469 RepID=M7C3V8_CHEMY|nr:Brain-specific homeobox/POU domain protein 3 [Chelonia mydas]